MHSIYSFSLFSGDSCAAIAKSFNCRGGKGVSQGVSLGEQDGERISSLALDFSGCNVSHVTVRAIADVLGGRCCCCCCCCGCWVSSPHPCDSQVHRRQLKRLLQLLHPAQQQPKNHRQAMQFKRAAELLLFKVLHFFRLEEGGSRGSGVSDLKTLISDGRGLGRMLAELSIRGLGLTCASMLQVY